MKKHLARLGPKLPRYYAQIMSVILLVLILAVPAMATDSTTGTSGNTQPPLHRGLHTLEKTCGMPQTVLFGMFIPR